MRPISAAARPFILILKRVSANPFAAVSGRDLFFTNSGGPLELVEEVPGREARIRN